jgi:putative NIF3 family GTP cyclohydrolase 1 type 2
VINQPELVTKLDTFFDVSAFDESGEGKAFPAGYDSVFRRFAAPGFWESAWNGLMLDNAAAVDRVYLAVFPAQNVLDTIIAREVERGAPGAIIFCHHLNDYQETGPGHVPIAEVHLEELREHHISYYVCHAPLDCHPEISTSTALANALRIKEQARFAAYHGGLAGVYGSVSTTGFHEFARKLAEVTALPALRYSSVRHNGRPVEKVGLVAGVGGMPETIQEALDLGCDTFVTGEWWLFGPGESRAKQREQMREFLRGADINLLGASHYASQMLVMRDSLPEWFREHIPAVETVFIPQDDPWR